MPENTRDLRWLERLLTPSVSEDMKAKADALLRSHLTPSDLSVLVKQFTQTQPSESLRSPAPTFIPLNSTRLQYATNSVMEALSSDLSTPLNVKPKPFAWSKGSFWGWYGPALLFSPVLLWVWMSLADLAGIKPATALLALLFAPGVGAVITAVVRNPSASQRAESARKEALAWREAQVSAVRSYVTKKGLAMWALHTALWLAIPERLHSRFEEDFTENAHLSARDWADKIRQYQEAPVFPPAPQSSPLKISPLEYEEFCAKHLRAVGYGTARTTRGSKDGGIDIESTELVVQCKHYGSSSVGVTYIREIFGIASHRRKVAVLMTSGKITDEARREANRFGVALISLSESSSVMLPLNKAGSEVVGRYQ